MARVVLAVSAAVAAIAGATAVVFSKTKKKKGGSCVEPAVNTSVVRLSKDGKRPGSPMADATTAAATGAPVVSEQPQQHPKDAVPAVNAEAPLTTTSSATTQHVVQASATADTVANTVNGSSSVDNMKPIRTSRPSTEDTAAPRRTSEGDSSKSPLGSKVRKPSGELVSSIVASIEARRLSMEEVSSSPSVEARKSREEQKVDVKVPCVVEAKPDPAPATSGSGAAGEEPQPAASGTKHDRSNSPVASAAQVAIEALRGGRVGSEGHLVKKPKQSSDGVEPEAVAKEAQQVAATQPEETPAQSEVTPSPKSVERAPEAPAARQEEAMQEAPATSVADNGPEEVAKADDEMLGQEREAAVKQLVQTVFKNVVTRAEAEKKAAASSQGSPSKSGGKSKGSSKKASAGPTAVPRPAGKKPKANDPCPCGRYFPPKKYKKCCGQGGY